MSDFKLRKESGEILGCEHCCADVPTALYTNWTSGDQHDPKNVVRTCRFCANVPTHSPEANAMAAIANELLVAIKELLKDPPHAR